VRSLRLDGGPGAIAQLDVADQVGLGAVHRKVITCIGAFSNARPLAVHTRLHELSGSDRPPSEDRGGTSKVRSNLKPAARLRLINGRERP
jgi:hypothetical protein